MEVVIKQVCIAFMSLRARGQLGLREDGRQSPVGALPEPPAGAQHLLGASARTTLDYVAGPISAGPASEKKDMGEQEVGPYLKDRAQRGADPGIAFKSPAAVGSLLFGFPDGFEGAVGLGMGQEALTSAHYLRSNTVESLSFSVFQSLASSAKRGQQAQGSVGVAADVPSQRAALQQRRNCATFLGPSQVSLIGVRAAGLVVKCVRACCLLCVQERA